MSITTDTSGRPDGRVRLALAGAGVIGNIHAKVLDELRDRIELVAVADPVLERAADLVARHGGTAYPSLGAALAAEDVDMVSVCTPTGRHGEVALEALRARKHVIIEKPAEITPARIDAIRAAQDEAGTKVAVISQHRFDDSTQALLSAVRLGELGRITSGIASIDWWRGQGYYDSGDWRGTWGLDGGGALMNQGVHTLDLLIAALGRPIQVFAFAGTLAHERISVEDVLVGVVRFENGALGALHATTAAYPGLSARLQVHGDKGSVIIDNDQLTFIHTTPAGADPEESAYGSASPSINLVDVTVTAEAGPAAASNPGGLETLAHRRQYENFLDALEGTDEIVVDLTTNRDAVAVIVAAYESARTGSPISLATP